MSIGNKIIRKAKQVKELAALYLSDRQLYDWVTELLDNRFTYLDVQAMIDIHEAVQRIDRQQVEGMILEAGCALGGSAILMTKSKKQDRKLRIYDVFGMIPPPTEKDGKDVIDRYETIKTGASKGIGKDTYYGYETDLMQKVKNNFDTCGVPVAQHQVELVKGLFEDTLNLNEPVALAHIDCDWYDSVMVCLERIAPKLAVGGTFIIDDYYSWSGCTDAVDDFFRNKQDEFTFEHKARYHITKK